MRLSDEQRKVLELVMSGRNVFFTGAAGTGKSVLLREIIRQLREIRNPDHIAVTATTGIAGINIGGSTVHSFAGVGLAKEPALKLAKMIKGSLKLYKRWNSVEVLVIDEISMMDALFFDKLEFIARVVRKCNQPFGGIQLVLSGDFFQLPPVPEQSYEYQMASTYAFDAKSWASCVPKPISLSQVFRQTDDTFIDILSSMRIGVMLPRHIQKLKELSRPIHYDDGIEASEIFPKRVQVEECNNARLDALPGPEYVYNSTDRSGHDSRHQAISKENAARLLERLVAIPCLTLKLGAQVMLIQNVIQKVLVNGSVGVVVEFMTTSEAVRRNIKIAQLSSKSRDDPEDRPDLNLLPINNNIFGHREKWPLVRFPNAELLCAPLEFNVQGPMGNIEASRLQVPLILAWALSVHKSQGQTLTRVKVHLSQVFEKGQAYVAVSRATTMDHLQITTFDPSKIMANPRVLAWHQHWFPNFQDFRIQEERETPQTPPEVLVEIVEEADSEVAIAQNWNDIDSDWIDFDDWNDNEDVFSPI